jgi:hypothetical protein
MEAGREAETAFLSYVKAQSEECKQAYIKKGIKVTEFTDEEYARWMEIAKNETWKPFMSEVKGSQELFAIIEKTK